MWQLYIRIYFWKQEYDEFHKLETFYINALYKFIILFNILI